MLKKSTNCLQNSAKLLLKRQTIQLQTRSFHKTLVEDDLKDDHTSIRKGPYGQFYHNSLTIEKTTTPLEKPAWEGLVFGKQFTDHMLEVDWTAEGGWSNPKIVPYHNLSLPPSCSSLHYAIQCFEGLKAYKTGSDVFLFRPEMNANRMNRSCARLGLPVSIYRPYNSPKNVIVFIMNNSDT